MKKENHSFRGFMQSGDGIITAVLESDGSNIKFQAEFGLPGPLVDRLLENPGNIVFSERSRIARLGVRMSCEPLSAGHLDGNRIVLKLSASQTIKDYPSIGSLSKLFTSGLPIGRLVHCDPASLLTSEEVYEAVRRADLKLPEATSISGDGSIIIAPRKIVCLLKEELKPDVLEQILLRNDGRELLNRYQAGMPVPYVTVPPGQGIITTCSMYLNDHYVVLIERDGGNCFELGRHFPAIVLDPIKTRGIGIYLEIFNESDHPIVNPLITAKVYRAETNSRSFSKNTGGYVRASYGYSYQSLCELEKRMNDRGQSTCYSLNKPGAAIPRVPNGAEKAEIFYNGPAAPCNLTHPECIIQRRLFSPHSRCAHVSSVSKIRARKIEDPVDIALKYFPNLIENRDIINMIFEGKIKALYFYEASHEHGPFLSQRDHNRLRDYKDLGLEVYWVSGLNRRVMVHTLRDGKGYFVVPERLRDFHKAMLFAFYGSNQPLSETGAARLGRLMDNLIKFWGKGIGIVTGGGSGVMERANTIARERGILSGANFLDITDQTMTTDIDFCQVFQSSCRHSRQKWFEIASFPIFNVGGLGTLEEIGITLCNMKLSISERVPIILFDTEGNGNYWTNMKQQIIEMVSMKRAPEWVRENLVITDDPNEVVEAYRTRLHLF